MNEKLPRGLRNNNPGNIIRTKGKPWAGEIPGNDPRFKTFRSMAYGYMAMLSLVSDYIEHKHLTTIRQIINLYAPPVENQTSKYVDFVSRKSGMSADHGIDHHSCVEMTKLVAAMSYMENGVPAVMADVLSGWNLLRQENSN